MAVSSSWACSASSSFCSRIYNGISKHVYTHLDIILFIIEFSLSEVKMYCHYIVGASESALYAEVSLIILF